MAIDKPIPITTTIDSLRQNTDVDFSPEELERIQETLILLEQEEGNNDAKLSSEEWQTIKAAPQFQGLFSEQAGNKLFLAQNAIDNLFQTNQTQNSVEENDFYADIQEQRQGFLHQIRLINGSGYNLNPLSTATATYMGNIGPSNPLVQTFYTLQQNDFFKITDRQGWTEGNNIPFMDYGDMTPDNVLQQASIVPLELDHRLLQTEQLDFGFFPYSIHAWFDGSNYGIIVWNWFEDEPLFVDACDTTQDAPQKMAQKAYRKLKRNFNSFNFNRAIKKLAPLTTSEQQELHNHKVFKLDAPPTWESSDVEQTLSAQKDLSQDFNLYITAHPCEADIDRAADHSPIIYGSLDILINPEALASSQQPLMLNGLVDVVRIRTKDIDKAKDLGRQLVNYENMNTPVFDKYGNAIFVQIGRERTTDKPILVGFDILPGYVYAQEPPSDDTFVKQGLDLSGFGFHDYEILFPLRKVFPERTPDQSTPYYLYEFIEDGALASDPDIFSTVSNATSNAEQAFGLEPGQGIQNIAYLPSAQRNAAVSFGNPETVTIWDEMLPTMNEPHGSFIVAHEAYHALDFQYSFSQYSEFQTLFNKLDHTMDKDFFEAIQEKNMLNIKEGGHPHDDAFELFASLMSSVFAPEWITEIGEMTERIRGIYYHSLCILEQALLAGNSNLETAPVMENIRSKIQTLTEVYGPFNEISSYYLTSVSETLSKHSGIMPMINADNFDQEVLLTTGNVVVYSYQENERGIVPHIISYAESHSTEATFVAMPFHELQNYRDREFSQMSDPYMFETGTFGNSIQSAGLYVFKDGQRIYQPDSSESLHLERDNILHQVAEIIAQ